MDISRVDLRVEPMRPIRTTLRQFTSNIVPFREGLLLHSNPLLFSAHVAGSRSIPITLVGDTLANLQAWHEVWTLKRSQ